MSNIECILNDDCEMETLFDNNRLQLNALALFLNNDVRFIFYFDSKKIKINGCVNIPTK
jgi:hypothetical protein